MLSNIKNIDVPRMNYTLENMKLAPTEHPYIIMTNTLQIT